MQKLIFRTIVLWVIAWLGLMEIASSQETKKENVQKKNVPRPVVHLTAEKITTRDHVYKRTPQGELALHCFFPIDWKATDKRPVIVFFFGGGWRNGSYTQFVPQSEYLASRGLVAISADYRIQSKHGTTPDVCVEDAKSAIRWVRSRATELGVDPQKLIASGGSAGGHLAACTALVEEFNSPGDPAGVSSVPNALVLYNPALNLQRAVDRKIEDGNGADIAARISPTRFLKPGAPPCLIYFGTADRMKSQGDEFLAKSRELKNRAEMFTAADMPHGFFNREPWLQITTIKTDEFLTSLGYMTGSHHIQVPPNPPALVRAD